MYFNKINNESIALSVKYLSFFTKKKYELKVRVKPFKHSFDYIKRKKKVT